MLEIGGHTLDVDPEATKGCYAQRTHKGPESCSCGYCENWVAGRDHIMPDGVLRILKMLGIPKDGEIHVGQVEAGPGDPRPNFYQGWYLSVGRIVDWPDYDPAEDMYGRSIAGLYQFEVGDWVLSFQQVTDSSQIPYGLGPFEGHPTIALCFYTWADNYIEY